MFFADKGRLDDEFNALYTSLFKKSDNYIKVVQALSTKNKGLTRDEILKATKLESNGHFTTILQDLINCDFIRCYRGYGNKSKMSIYQLTDPFSLFYYKFIKNNGKTDKPFWQFQIGTRQHDTWAGLAFEQLCLNHHKQIEQALGIAVISTKVYSWTTPQSAEEKAQIDLIIKRADKVINVCEMKNATDPYALTKAGGRPCATRYMTSRPSRVPKRRSRNADHDIWPQGERPCRHVPVGRDGKGPVRLRDVLPVHV
jgi:hypothetical protein